MPLETTRILFWADNYGSLAGGAEVWGERYVNAMARRGYEFEVLAADGNGYGTRADAGAPVHALQTGRALRSSDSRAFLGCMKQAAAVRGRFRPHLSHLSMGTSAPLLSTFLLSGGSSRPGVASGDNRLPTIASLHYEWPENLVHPGCLLEPVLKQMDVLACFSNSTLRWTCDRWPFMAARSVMIPHALPDFALTDDDLPPEGAPQTIAFIGRLAREKGADLAIETFSLLSKRFPLLRLVVAGDGHDRIALTEMACALGVEQGVTFAGWLTEQDVHALICSSSLVLMPSREESFGLVALETARAARPLVACRVGGLPEVCLDGETGILCPPEDPEALCAAAARLLLDPALARQMGQEARAHFLRFAGWEEHLDAYEELIQRALRAGSERDSTHAPALSVGQP